MTKRCAEPPLDKVAFWKETAIPAEDLEQWLAKEKPASVAVMPECEEEICVAEFLAAMPDGKTHARRVLVGGSSEPWLRELEERLGL